MKIGLFGVMFSYLIAAITVFPVQAAPKEDLGQDVAKTLAKTGDNLDKSMKDISTNVKKGVANATASANAKMKSSEKPSPQHADTRAPYTVQKAESDLGKVGQNLDNSMKSAAANLHKTMAQANHNSTTAAKKH